MMPNPRISRRTAIASLAALALGSSRALAAAPSKTMAKETQIVEKATDALAEITDPSRNGMPIEILRQSQGLVIVPDLFKAGFVIGGQFGRGVLIARDESGEWTNPVFLGIAGGSFGAQIGAASTDLFLVFRTRRSVDDLLRNNKVTIGAGVEAAAGPVGAEIGAATDLKMRAEILSYSRSRGLFAGASVAGASLHVRHRSHDLYYGVPNLMVGDILAGRDFDDQPLAVPASAIKLRATLNVLTAPPAERDAEVSKTSTRGRERRR